VHVRVTGVVVVVVVVGVRVAGVVVVVAGVRVTGMVVAVAGVRVCVRRRGRSGGGRPRVPARGIGIARGGHNAMVRLSTRLLDPLGAGMLPRRHTSWRVSRSCYKVPASAIVTGAPERSTRAPRAVADV
jgi:hypothetical protein